ncbi:MAG: hypothetical protein AAFN10_27120 [Bacteroidota bacterium]
MKNWQQYQQAEPILQEIEGRFERLQKFESRYPESMAEELGLTPEDIRAAREALFESLKAEASLIDGKVYYWLYPFYKGNFLTLVAALGSVGAMDRQKDDDESRSAFYRFFRSVPMEERLLLGERLDHPELTEQAQKIQTKIQNRRQKVESFVNKNFAN